MNKLFLIFFISSLIGKFDTIAQVVLRNKDIVKLTIEDFPQSIYYKVLKTKPETHTSFVSAKTIDGGCINYQTKEFDFKKEKVKFIFQNNYDSTQTIFLESVFIKGKKTPFITQDSIKVGDKILITTICKDIDKLKEQINRWKDNYVQYIFYNNITYYIKKTPLKKISSKTIIKIKQINIRTYNVKT
jgi:hypothetical protein